MSKLLIKILSVLFLVFLLLTILFISYEKLTNSLIFIFKDVPNINDITVNSELVTTDKYGNNYLYPQTMNILYPAKVSVKWQTQNIKIKSLSKNNWIKINIIYFDKWKIKRKIYKLQTITDDFPYYTVENNGLTKGYIFTTLNALPMNKVSTYALIVDYNGKLIFFRKNEPNSVSIINFQKWKLKNNKILYGAQIAKTSSFLGYYFLLDKKFNLIKVLKALPTSKHTELYLNEHDIMILDDKHYVVLAFILPGEKDYLIPVIQEIKDDEVVFEWISSEHPEIDDSNFKEDPFHINSIDISPYDGNFILSAKVLNTIYKIDRKTGKIIWQFGGENSNFNLSDDETFMWQHHVHYENDKLVIFDNNFSTLNDDIILCRQKVNCPQPSRILKYLLDEENMKIKEKEIIELDDDIHSMGSAQTLSNSNILISCGFKYTDGHNPNCAAKIITPKKETIWKLKVNKPYFTYKSYYDEKID